MASRYWVGNGGDWVTAGNDHWSETSGGAPGASNPTSSDDIYFDANSFSSANQTVNITTRTATCNNMDWTGATNSPTLTSTGGVYGIEISGSATFISAMTVTLSQSMTFKGTGNITTNGLTINALISIATGASITLQDNLTVSAANGISFTGGIFDTNGKSISTTKFSCTGSTARTLTLGSSVVTCSDNITFISTNLTMTASTSKFVMTGNSKAFGGGGVTFNNLEIQGTPTTILGNNTFNDLKLTAGKTVNFENGSTQTLTTLSGNGTPTARIAMLRVSSGTFTISIATGTIKKYYYYIKDCVATGGATFNAYNTLDYGNNTGWNFYDLVPVVSYPVSETIIVNDDVTFTWDSLAEIQTHYDLDISTNGIVWTNYADKIASTDPECVITAGTLSSRIYYWRVRIYFIDGEQVTPYSQTSFIAVINPETSEVDCDEMPMPTVTWVASEQQAFQIKFGDYDTGTIYSALGTYKIPYYFDDDTYGIQVRTQNNLGTWSVYTAIAYFAVLNVPGDAITLTASQTGNAVVLVWETTGTYENYYIYRDNVPIASVDDTAYTDNYAYGSSVYKVRGIMDDDYYTMSNEVTQAMTLTYDIIADTEATILTWFDLKHSLGSPVSRNYGKSDNVDYLRFEGRSYPVPARTNQKNGRGSFSYAFKTVAEIDALMDLSGRIVMLKDTKGNRTIGIINDMSVTYTGKFYYTLSFGITVTDYSEAVPYD